MNIQTRRPRLGSIDTEIAPFKAELADNKIAVIDLTKVKVSDEFNHSKVAESHDVVRLIAGMTGVAGAAGRAAGLVLAAPVAVIDKDTHDNYASPASMGWPVSRVASRKSR